MISTAWYLVNDSVICSHHSHLILSLLTSFVCDLVFAVFFTIEQPYIYFVRMYAHDAAVFARQQIPHVADVSSCCLHTRLHFHIKLVARCSASSCQIYVCVRMALYAAWTYSDCLAVTVPARLVSAISSAHHCHSCHQHCRDIQ